MKIKPGYMLRKVVEIYVIIGIGDENYAPNQIMSLNETGVFLWRILEEGAERDQLVARLLAEYDVDEQTATADVDAFLTSLREKALIAE